jgi:NADPH-dependent glutamate synthase beta subunit-like oxidoreductase
MTAAAPQNLVSLRVPDDAHYWTEMVKCRHACPVHTDACGYVTAIAEGRYEDAYRKIRATNPFASICGRVCGAPCELNCRRRSVDEPVAIRALKRFINERYGAETGDYSFHRDFADRRMLPPKGEYEKVAVVGGGVSGMTVAHDLTHMGYRVTVFEADSEPGGMLTVGVPVYRLPRDLVRHEIQAILSLGVELKCNMRLGRDFSLQSLRQQGYAAIFLGIGLPKGRKIPIPGADLEDVYDGMEFLRAFNQGKPLPLGRRVAVIGGGNVAYDVARSALRPVWYHGEVEPIEETDRSQQMTYDVARSALRLSGDKEIHLVCLESRDEMPADEIEIEEGAEEGVHLHTRRGPLEVVANDQGRVAGLRLRICQSVFDEAGRFNPVYEEGRTEEIPCDTVVFAIGQTSDLSFLAPEDGVASERGLIKVNPETYQTTAPDVFACGDIAHGPRLFIDAVASAQIAARSMHDFLRKTRTDVVLRKQWSPAQYTMREGWQTQTRENPPALEPEKRTASNEIVEINYPEWQAREQASRCLRCNVNTVFDTSKCIACNGCVDVCPNNLIRLVGLSALVADDVWMERASEATGLPPEEIRALPASELDAMGAVMTKDESTCIRCAMCASRCPTHAITMQQFDHHWEVVTVNSPNPKILYEARV